MPDPILPDIAAFLDTFDEVEDQVQTQPLSYGKAPIMRFGPDEFGFAYYLDSNQLLAPTGDQSTLLNWIQKAVRTPRGVYPIYGPDYGTDLAGSMGQTTIDELMLFGIEDFRRCLTLHPLVSDVVDVSYGRGPDSESVFCAISLIDRLQGQVEVTVVI